MNVHFMYILADGSVAINVAVAMVEVLYKPCIRLLIDNYLFMIEASCLF